MAVAALLDANVIWSAPLRDTLLWAAWQGCFRPVWSEAIIAEMTRTLKARRPDLDPSAVDRTAARMRLAFPGALVTGYEHRIDQMTNAPGDRHVLAAAVEAGVSAVVTWNVRDFPAGAREPYGIEAQTPDEFLCHLWEADPPGMVAAIAMQAANLKRPARTPREVLVGLQATVPQFARLALDSGLLEDRPGL